MKSVLILGGTGMLGHKLFKDMFKETGLIAYSTVRSTENLSYWFTHHEMQNMISGVDATRIETVYDAINQVKPDAVINCIGIIKQLPEAKDAVTSITVNSLFPHLLAEYCGKTGIRLIHISTDCVFDGKKGNYLETDMINASDLYGRTKQLGELTNYRHAVTLRTSVIGHELKHHVSLIDWFFKQSKEIKGFTQAIYTGFPTVEFSRIIKQFVIPNSDLHGLYHVASSPISKYELLKLVAEQYGKNIEIIPYDQYMDNKSLNSQLFQKATGYTAPSWNNLIKHMYDDYTFLQKDDVYGFESYDSRWNKAGNY